MSHRIILLLALGLAALILRAEDWPQFRGPGGQGHSNAQQLPLVWSESQNVVWKSRVPGLGWSSPVVANGRIWMTTAVDDRGTASIRAIADDIESGREIINVEVFRI